MSSFNIVQSSVSDEISHNNIIVNQLNDLTIETKTSVDNEISSANTNIEPTKQSNDITTDNSITNEVKDENLSNNVVIYWHPDCYEHNIPDHPEQPDRMTSILNKLRLKYIDNYFREASLADNSHLLLFHNRSMVDKFNRISDYVEEAKIQKKYAMKMIDSDTVVMWKTRSAALRAAGAVISALDDIYSPTNTNKIKRAFCCVRPPGHHAERLRSMGFCFVNNIGIGAKYAQSKYNVGRIAIVDFDVHHGNGSEDGALEDESIFFGSTHEKDNYPGTGADPTPNIGDKVLNPKHRRIVNRYLQRGPYSRVQFKEKWKQIIDEMILFKPELIFISAGFDAHDDDPLSSTELIEEDFEWATRIVIDASYQLNPINPVPIISSLEGGYDLKALANSVAIHVDVMNDYIPDSIVNIDCNDSTTSTNNNDNEVKALIKHMEDIGLK
mmetsp:Transcript_10566/g.9503  ORF Transcript_10566/g.9503 Transcript_10566/m.9503 type:complete len:441 (-) Transcript_10566:32-1354(-)